ncbi:MAG: alpha/beta hydrolase [Kiritimatiellae bacterium]|nr:alpha/beta hydrolase [Kiritimatiellia bacterium]
MHNLMAYLFFFATAAANGAERQYIWPEDLMPDPSTNQIAAMTDVSRAKGFVPGAWRRPYIEWDPEPDDGLRSDACIILISGGGYQNQCDVGLVKEWRKRFAKEGVRTVNFVHRTPRPEGKAFYMSAWQDGQRAVRIVRSEAAKRGFDPEKIGVVSMSAGSHLAALLAASSQTPAYVPVDRLDEEVPCHINFACAFAPAYGMTDGLGEANANGGNPPAILDSCFKFDAKSAPMCLLHGGKDKYSPITSTMIYRRLREKGVPAEVHLYPDRGHGAHGLDRAVEFMRQMGFLGPLGAEEKLMDRFADDSARASCEKIPLWPSKDNMPDIQTNQCTPYLEWHIPKELKTKAVQIIWSGGSYRGNNPDGFEVAPARRYLNEKGMTVVTVKYRTPRPAKPLAKHRTAWEDAQRAIRMVRAGAKERGLDPERIGVMGSSAGGHLALLCATSSSKDAYAEDSYEPVDQIDIYPASVAWAVCIYPAYSLTDGLESKNVTGGNADWAVPAPEFAFDKSTPPMLFIHGDADGWSSMASVKAWEKLRRMGIQGEVHTLAGRTHCFQKEASPGTGSYTWLDRIWEFMSAKGFNR